MRYYQARRQDIAAGGPHFKNTVLDVCSNQGAKREMGGHRFQMGGPGTTGPPVGDGPGYYFHFLCFVSS